MNTPRQPGSGHSPKSAWSAPIVTIAGFAGVTVLALSIILGLIFISPNDKGQNHSQDVDGSRINSEPASPNDSADNRSADGASEPSSSSLSTTTTTTRDQPSVPGTDWQGFVAGGPRCNAAGDPAVTIAQTNRSQIVICRVGQGGGYYYKGLAGGNAIEIQNPSRVGGGWQTINNGVSYQISSGALVITQNGRTFSEAMQHYWSK